MPTPKKFAGLGLLTTMFLSGLACSGLGLFGFWFATRDHRAAAWHDDMGGIAIIAGVILAFVGGGLVGNYAGAIFYLKNRKPRAAGWMCIFAGSVITLLAVLPWTVSDKDDPGTKSLDLTTDIGRNNAICFGVAFLVIAALLYFGVRLIRRPSPSSPEM